MNHIKEKLLEKIQRANKSGGRVESYEFSLKLLAADHAQAHSAWDSVVCARKLGRASTKDYIALIFDDFMELHGDRYFGDDRAVMGGIATLQGKPVTVIGIVKGATTEANILHNFGMANPEGYRKAQRLMKQAEKFNRPIITFIDTPGAFPGVGAEERGQGQAIAESLRLMMGLTVPVIAIVLGEAGSGGALALGVGNEVWMMQHAIYSVLSPEGFASILYKDASLAPRAADAMKLTSQNLLELGIIDEVFPEYDDVADNAALLQQRLIESIELYQKMKRKHIQKHRQDRFRAIGAVNYDK